MPPSPLHQAPPSCGDPSETKIVLRPGDLSPGAPGASAEKFGGVLELALVDVLTW